MKIIIDSREQLPYHFETFSEVGTLACGDYSIVGLENHIAVERKTVDDLVSCLTNGRERFEKELHRGKALDYFCLLLECSLSDLAEGRYRSDMNPKSAIQSLIAFSVRYRLPVWLAGNREYGQRVTESLLLKYANQIERKFKKIKDAVGPEEGRPEREIKKELLSQTPTQGG